MDPISANMTSEQKQDRGWDEEEGSAANRPLPLKLRGATPRDSSASSSSTPIDPFLGGKGAIPACPSSQSGSAECGVAATSSSDAAECGFGEEDEEGSNEIGAEDGGSCDLFDSLRAMTGIEEKESDTFDITLY